MRGARRAGGTERSTACSRLRGYDRSPAPTAVWSPGKATLTQRKYHPMLDSTRCAQFSSNSCSSRLAAAQAKASAVQRLHWESHGETLFSNADWLGVYMKGSAIK